MNDSNEGNQIKAKHRSSGSEFSGLVMPEFTQGVCDDGAAILMDGKPMTVDEIVSALNVNERLLHERQRLLDSIPECDVHGSCVPHAIEWVEKHKALSARVATVIGWCNGNIESGAQVTGYSIQIRDCLELT